MSTLPLFITTVATNDTFNSTHDTSICHPYLLAQGNKSEFGLCDDYPSAIALAAILLFAHIVLALANMIGLYYKLHKMKRNVAKVNYLTVARSPALMIIGTLLGAFLNFIMLGRILIGR